LKSETIFSFASFNISKTTQPGKKMVVDYDVVLIGGGSGGLDVFLY
jgi:hypothetical protein